MLAANSLASGNGHRGRPHLRHGHLLFAGTADMLLTRSGDTTNQRIGGIIPRWRFPQQEHPGVGHCSYESILGVLCGSAVNCLPKLSLVGFPVLVRVEDQRKENPMPMQFDPKTLPPVVMPDREIPQLLEGQKALVTGANSGIGK